VTQKKVLGLMRVSSDSQDTQRQFADLELLTRKYGLELVRVLELKGISGTSTLTNEQVQMLLADLEKPGVQGLALSSLDRLFRPRRYASFAILDRFDGRLIWSAREGEINPGSDSGFDVCVSAGGRAGSELREIARRCRDGKSVKRAAGAHVTGNQSLPRGLRFDRRAGWSYDEAEVAKVRDAYALLFADRYTLSEIARRAGFPAASCVRRVLENPTWKGLRVYPASSDRAEPLEVALPLDPLLSPEQWALAQRLLAKHRTWSKETRDQRFLGAGLLVCGKCGQRFYFHCDTRRGYHDTYHCASRHKGGPGCGALRLHREIVDRALEGIVANYLLDAAFLAAVFARLAEPAKPDHSAKRREAELGKLKARRTRLVDALENGLIDKAEFAARADRLQAAAAEVEARMPAAAPPPLPDVRAVVAGLARAFSRFGKLPFTERRSVLRRVVRSVQVVEAAIPAFTLSGAFLGEMSHTKPEQHLRLPYSRRPRGRSKAWPSTPRPGCASVRGRHKPGLGTDLRL
jgi:DNA invertase Pin-like site-specific DNA recombinase